MLPDLTVSYVELYRRGEYNKIPLFNKQLTALRILESKAITEQLYGGAARGGKSWYGCTWQILRRLAYPESYGLIAREEHTKLTDTTLKTFFKVCSFLDLELNKHYKFNGSTSIAEFTNGSHIFFREIKYIPSDPQFDRLGSYDLTDCFLDEAQQIHWKAREILRARLSVLSGKGWKTTPKMLYTCNPSKNWIYKDFYKPSKENRLSSDMSFISSLPKDNPFTDQAYLDNLAKADNITKQRLLFGNFEYDDDPNLLVEYDAILDLFENNHVLPGEGIISADIAMQGRDRFIIGRWSGFRCTIAVDKPKTDGKEVEMDLREEMNGYGIPSTRVVVDSDGLGAYLSGYIKNVKQFHGGSRPYNSLEYANLKAQCAFILAGMINKREIKIICTDSQMEAIKEEITTCLKRDNVYKDQSKKNIISKDLMKQYLGRSPDYLDMLIMRMVFTVQHTVQATWS